VADHLLHSAELTAHMTVAERTASSILWSVKYKNSELLKRGIGSCYNISHHTIL